ncbi:MAG TPA: hypothetical protein DCZ01_02350 [Elusimicrobia bacterium]|nr:hypothetical protein [Elusimicrobiota bacterium]
MVARDSKLGGTGMQGEVGGGGLKETENDLVEGLGEEQEKDREKEDSKLLTEKTVRLLRVIAEHGYLTINEIGFIYRHQTHAYRVLKGLKDLNLVGEFDTTLRPRTGYFLRAKGYRTLRERGQLRLKRRFDTREFKTFIFTHRMACAKVGIMLEDHPLVKDFLPESLLWERRKDADEKLCDGEFLFKAPGWEQARRVGLEVELTLKNSEKLRESFESFIRRRDLDQVWWVCGNPTIAKALGYWIGRIRRHTEQQHFLCTLEEALKTQHQLGLHDRLGQLYSIAPDNPTLPEMIEPDPPPIPPKAELPPVAPAPPPPSAVGMSPAEIRSWRNLERPLWARVLVFAWRWLRESWREEKYQDESYMWQSRFRFTRWREFWIVAAVLAFWQLALLAEYWLRYQEGKGWRERTLLSGEVRDRRWSIRPVFLASKGHSYRLALDGFNEADASCDLDSVRIKVPGGVVVSEIIGTGKFRHVRPGSGVRTVHDFEASPKSRRFLAVYTATGGRFCASAVVPVEFK